VTELRRLALFLVLTAGIFSCAGKGGGGNGGADGNSSADSGSLDTSTADGSHTDVGGPGDMTADGNPNCPTSEPANMSTCPLAAAETAGTICMYPGGMMCVCTMGQSLMWLCFGQNGGG
jgi:hypothetical protein